MAEDRINSSKAPEPVGLYPHTRRVGSLLFLSGVLFFILASCGETIRNKKSQIIPKDTTNNIFKKENLIEYYDSTTKVTTTKESGGYVSTYHDSTSNVTVMRKYDNSAQIIRSIHTIVNKNNYFIDSVSNNGVGILPEPVVEPTGKYLFYGTGSICGFEGAGVTLMRSDVFGKNKDVIIKSCRFIERIEILNFNDMSYLLVQMPNYNDENDDACFLIYNVLSMKEIAMIEGIITRGEKGNFSYSSYDKNSNKYRPNGTVTLKQLINGEKPLKPVRKENRLQYLR